jgi:hypothetical protein
MNRTPKAKPIAAKNETTPASSTPSSSATIRAIVRMIHLPYQGETL